MNYFKSWKKNKILLLFFYKKYLTLFKKDGIIVIYFDWPRTIHAAEISL